MGIFDNLKNAANMAGPPASFAKDVKTEKFTFNALPESLDELKALPQATLDTPFKTAALTICALCAYAAAPDIGIEMLDFLRGPRPLSAMDKQFLKDRFEGGKYYKPFSFFAGATPENDYTPSQPFTISVESTPYSYTEEGYAKLQVRSGGADSPRGITLRRKGDGQWCLWEQYLLSDIRVPKSQDPWA